MTEVDVAVVGAGLLGTAAARHLRLAGASVALVGPDAADLADGDRFPGSSADVSRLAHLLDLPAPTIPAALRTRTAYEKLSASTGVPILTHRPHLIVVSSRSGHAGHGGHVDRASILANAEAQGIGIEELDGAEVERLHPELSLGPHIVALRLEDGGIIDPSAAVVAQERAFLADGGTRIHDLVVTRHTTRTGTTIDLADGGRIRARRTILALGAYALTTHLLDRRPLARVMGATVVTARVTDPLPNLPSLMYHDLDDAGEFRGLVVPPVRYPDGVLRIKGAGASLRNHPLTDAAEMRDWMRSDGDRGDVEVFRNWFERRLPGITVDAYDTAPCLVVATPSGLPYLGPVDDHTLLLCEGMHGATLADDLGRMAAAIALDGDSGLDTDALHPVWS